MSSILVSYIERRLDQAQNETFHALGSESLDGISEVLLPRSEHDRTIYFVKKFYGHDCYQWLVHSVEPTAPTTTTCAAYKVVLNAPPSSGATEYLHQTLNKGTRRSLSSTVRPGNLVEVDYGHELTIGRSDGELRSNKRYSDTIQNGEMHKRRLAVVVSTSRRTTLQVAPITSQEPATTDKTTFELSDETLKQLKFYGNSGKRSWAIASMIETVSTRRVLPPVSYYEGRGGVRSGRDTNYSVSLSSSETRSLKEALLHSISVRDYYENQSALANAKARISVLEPLSDRVNELEAQLLTLQAETEHLRLCKEVADMWATNMNLDLLDEVDMLRALYSGR